MSEHKAITITGLLLLFWLALPVLAQEGVTLDDRVNDVAEHMYCPICENEPLDDCRNPTCIQWKNEIADQILAGRNQDEIIDWFVTRYGEQVVGVPQDAILRAFAFAAPIIGTLAGLAFAIVLFRRWHRNTPAPTATGTLANNSGDAAYRSRIEQDLQ